MAINECDFNKLTIPVSKSVFNYTLEQQQLIYKNLLLQTSCINQKALLHYLKTTLPQESYNSLNLEDATYENVVDVTAELMATSI